MTQNSLSPVVKSRISSSSGRIMRVEKRSLARTGTMSSFEYFTTRAATSVAACVAEGWKTAAPTMRRANARKKESCNRWGKICFIVLLLLRSLGLLEHFGHHRAQARQFVARQK